MRLPWPLDRWNRDASGADEAAPGVDDAARADRESTPTASPTGAWATLPPIQRSVGDAPLVAPSSSFLAGVSGAQPLPPIVEPLGHDVGPLAPSGVVAAATHPVASLTSNVSLVPRPVQRGGVTTNGAAAAMHEHAPPEANVVAPAAGTSAGPAQPVRRLGIVPAEAAATPPPRPFTRAEPAALTGPPAPRAPDGVPVISRREWTAAGTRPEPAAAPSRQAGAPVVARSVSPSTTGDAAAVPGVSSPPPMRPRRAGLGPPLPGASPTSSPVAVHGPGVIPAAGGSGASPNPTISRSAAPDGAGPLHAPLGAGAGSRPRFRAATRVAPQAPAIRPERSTAARVPDAAGRPGEVPDHGSGATAHRPSLPVLRVARGTASSDPATLGPGTAGDAAVQRMPAARPPSPLEPSGPTRRPLAGSRPPVAAPSLQRRGGPDAGGASPRASRASVAAPFVASGDGTTGPPADRHLVARPDDSGAAVAHAGRLPDVAGTSPRFGAIGSAPRAAAAPTPRALALASVQRSAAPGAAPPADGPAHTSATATTPPPGSVPPAPVLAPTATAIVQRVDGAAPVPPPADEGRSDHELDELARKLFGRFQNRLRAELIYEREAKGLTFDS